VKDREVRAAQFAAVKERIDHLENVVDKHTKSDISRAVGKLVKDQEARAAQYGKVVEEHQAFATQHAALQERMNHLENVVGDSPDHIVHYVGKLVKNHDTQHGALQKRVEHLEGLASELVDRNKTWDAIGVAITSSQGVLGTRLTCTENHFLSDWVLPKIGKCDGCGKRLSSGESVMDCRICKWCLCRSCHFGPEGDAGSLKKFKEGLTEQNPWFTEIPELCTLMVQVDTLKIHLDKLIFCFADLTGARENCRRRVAMRDPGTSRDVVKIKTPAAGSHR